MFVKPGFTLEVGGALAASAARGLGSTSRLKILAASNHKENRAYKIVLVYFQPIKMHCSYSTVAGQNVLGGGGGATWPSET